MISTPWHNHMSFFSSLYFAMLFVSAGIWLLQRFCFFLPFDLPPRSMAYGGGDGLETAMRGTKFLKLSGEPIPLKAPEGSKVCDVKPGLAQILGGGSLRLIDETGKMLEANDVVTGDVQVQVMSIADGAWSKLFSAAFRGFDEAQLRATVTAAWPGDFVRSGNVPAGEDVELKEWQEKVFEQLQPAITSSCGEWADYWTFGSSADSYGYFYVRPPYPTMQPTVDLFVTDVKRWQKLLLELEDEFAHLRSRCGGYALCEHLEVAIAALLRHCPAFCTDVSWHVGFEMWYSPFSDLVSWYLSSAGLEESNVDVLNCVSNAILGFRSYQCPADTALVVAQQVADRFHLDFSKLDSTADWLRSRSALTEMSSRLAANSKTGSQLPACLDTHLRFIEAVDGARDLARAQRMKDALAACRKAAKAGKTLSLDLLLTWHCHLMNISRRNQTTFRRHDAYAKQGRERYPLHSGDDGGPSKTETQFFKLLEEADTAEPVALRASRAYLDVCFFHPFDDGCSRLARLVFDFILTRDNVAVNGVESIFLFGKSARDAEGAQRLVELVDQGLAKPQLKDLDDPPDIRHASCEETKWFSCQNYPVDNQDFLFES